MTNSIRILSELFPKAINNCDSRSHIKIEDNANPSRKISGAVRAVSAKLHILSTVLDLLKPVSKRKKLG